MKKVNLLKEIIQVDKKEFLKAINSNKEFVITIDGKVVVEPKGDEIVIYKGKYKPISPLAPKKTLSAQDFLGANYKVVENEELIMIKASLAWQDIIKLNYDNASYDDTTSDGVSEFTHKKLEDIGWYATDFDITYRELVDILEENCEGVLLCVEQDEPYRFSGLGFIEDEESASEFLYKKVQEIIKNKIKEDEDYLDETEALNFFQISL